MISHKSYIPSVFLAVMIMVILFCFMLSLIFPALILCIFLMTALYFYRRPTRSESSSRLTKNLLVTPASGKLVFHTDFEGKQSVIIRKSFFHEFGLYFPFRGTVDFIHYHKKKTFMLYRHPKVLAHNLEKYGHYHIKIRHDDWGEVSLRVYPVFKKFATLQTHIKPGDRGEVGGLLGVLPWGGYIQMVLPEQFDLAVPVGYTLRAYESYIGKNQEGHVQNET